MPDKATLQRAKQDRREGKSPTTQAGEFVHEEIKHIREGKHGARSAKQAIAIGLAKARRAGLDLPPPPEGRVSERTRRSAASASRAGKRGNQKVSRTRSRATREALKHEGHSAASTEALSKQAHAAAARKPASERAAAAKRAARTKGATGRSVAAKKAARTRARRGR